MRGGIFLEPDTLAFLGAGLQQPALRRIAGTINYCCRAVSPEEFGAGWSSPVARQAHNLKVVGSNPTPATKYRIDKPQLLVGAFCL